MSEVFSVRSLIYWWAALSSTIFLKEWLRQLGDFVQKPGTFIQNKFPFNLIPGLNTWIDGAADFIRTRIGFDPNQVILTAPVRVPGWIIAILFGLILLGLGISLYIRALRSSAWFDDFLSLIVVYMILRIEGHIVALASLPLLNQVRDFVNNPTAAFLVMLVLLLVLVFFGEGFRSKTAFWRALVEGLVLAIFMFPAETANAVGYMIKALAAFGASLAEPVNAPFAIVWGVLGMILAFQRLTKQERVDLRRG